MIIYTTGCPKSGTTLMQNLISLGFVGGYHVRRQEQNALVAEIDDPLITPACRYMSAKCKPQEAVNWARKKDAMPARVVWIVRHPYSLILSKSVVTEFVAFHNHPRIVLASFNRLAKIEKDDRVLVVRFEDLIEDPEAVQRQIAEAFDLTIARPFSDCYTDFDLEDVEAPALRGARPPDRTRIAPWEHRDLAPFEISKLDGSLKAYPKLFDVIAKYGYNWRIDGVNIHVVDQHERRLRSQEGRRDAASRDESKNIL